MTNQEISKILYEIADLLELTDVSRFEIIAYQNAARTVEFLQTDLSETYRQSGLGGLQGIKGIGLGISKNVAELFDTGTLEKKKYLLKKIPKVMVEINAIPSVGPKTTKKLYEILKPKNFSDFERKLKSPSCTKKLESISVKEKTISNILRGIEIKERLSVRAPLGLALPIAEYFVNHIKEIKGVTKVDAVGSLRRMRETVGDIDIIATTKDAKTAIAEFVKLSEVKKILAQGPISARIVHSSGMQVDLKILPNDEYGSLLQHFTGSKEHNVELRTWAVEKGWSISEHGIKSKDNEIIKCPTEEKLYSTLGMQFIPPEIREGQGEVKIALEKKIPHLVELKDIKGDLQMHSTASDGKTSIADLAQAASLSGYEYIGITDHSTGIGVTGGLDAKGLEKQAAEIDKINQKNAKEKNQFTILKGIEVNIRADGKLDLPDSALEKLDFVVASIHSSFNQSSRQTTDRYLQAINNPHVDIIAHPTGRILGRRDELNVIWEEVFKACVSTKTALEINAGLDRLDLPPRLAREAVKQGVKIVISTDAHSPEGLLNMRFGVAQARRAWLTKHEILTTLERDELLRWLKR